MQPQRLDQTTLLEQVAQEIEQRILRGQLADGERLPSQEELSAEFGVSRPIVRESLALLRARGYVETINGRGTFVRHPDASHLAETFIRQVRLSTGEALTVDALYEARTAIETTAARLAATRADEDACRELADYLQTMRDHADDPAAYTAADLGFHIAVARAARNPFLATMITPLVQVIVEGIFESHGAADAVDLGISAHSEILDRIEQRDPQGAMRAMEEHLLASRRLFPGQVMERLVGSGD